MNTSFILISLNFSCLSFFDKPDSSKYFLKFVLGNVLSGLYNFLFFSKSLIYFPKFINFKLYLLISLGSFSILCIPKEEKGKKRISFSSGIIDISSISAWVFKSADLLYPITYSIAFFLYIL